MAPRAGLQRNAVSAKRGPAQLLACKKAAARPPARRAHAYLKGGYGGLVGFELKGGFDAGQAFINALKLFYHVANIGDARSLAIHPASTTHAQLNAVEQRDTGVTEGYVRLSIGIEHIDDIIADLTQALDAAGSTLTEAAE